MRIEATRGKQGIGMEVKDATDVEATQWGKYRWWRYVLGLMVILFSWLVVGSVGNAMEQTLEQNKTFIRNHFEEFVNRKNSAIAYQNFAPNFIDREEPFVGLVSPELVKQTMEKAYVKYPDLHVTVEDAIAEGDKVMVRCLWRGTDASTGKKMEFKGFVLWRLADGKLAERWATVTPPLR